jgi:hypothetical protein
VENYEIEKKYGTNISLFERLINMGVHYSSLKVQRRMKKKFADFIRIIYKDQYIDHDVVGKKNEIMIKGLVNDLIFFDHRNYEK